MIHLLLVFVLFSKIFLVRADIYPNNSVTTVRIRDENGERNVAYFLTSTGYAVIGGDIIYGTEEEFNRAIVNGSYDRKLKRRELITRKKRSNSIWPNSPLLWPGNTILYKFESAAVATQLSTIVNTAIGRWTSQVPCLRFVLQPPSAVPSVGVVTIYNTDGCSANVGHTPFTKAMHLGPGCGENEATHEWGHVLGLFHEQKRHDRENSNTHFICENVRGSPPPVCCQLDTFCCGLACQFTYDLTSYTDFDGQADGGAYDITSIMHYRQNAFAKPGLVTLTKGPVSNPPFPSTGDIARIKKLYKCTPPAVCPPVCNPLSNTCHIPTAQTCIFPNPSVPNPRAACACRAGYKANFPGDRTDKHWRLPVVGQEDRVWVAEGVPCDILCDQPFGTPSCREVNQLPSTCVGG